jgi:hypothetical protein
LRLVGYCKDCRGFLSIVDDVAHSYQIPHPSTCQCAESGLEILDDIKMDSKYKTSDIFCKTNSADLYSDGNNIIIVCILLQSPLISSLEIWIRNTIFMLALDYYSNFSGSKVALK